MHTLFTPIVAAVFDFAHLAGILVVLFVAVMKHLFEANKPKNGPAIPPQRKPQQAPQPQPAPAGGQQADQLRSQVEEFLRRAGKPQQPAGQPAQKPQTRPASEIEILVDDSRKTPERRALADSSRPDGKRQDPFAAGDKQRAARRPKWRKSVADHVAEHVSASTQSLAQQSSRLGQRIVSEDQQFDQKLKAKFDHTIGTLGGSAVDVQAAAQQPPTPTTPAAQIAAMLANPDGVRQAVLLNEILRPPAERW